MKEGLFLENDELIYYKNDKPYHAGVVKIDGDIYYIGSHGRAAKGRHIVHREMANDILKRGTYTFGDDYKLVKGSYVAPKKIKRKKSGSKRKSYRRAKLDRKKTLIASVSVAAALLLMVAIFWIEDARKAPSGPAVSTEPTSRIVLPELKEDVLLCSGSAKMEYDGELDLKSAVQTGNPYRSFLFYYQLSSDSGTLYLSEDPAMTAPRPYELDPDKDYISIHNLKTGTTYYYKVVVDNEQITGSFQTAPSTRFVYIPGLNNTRDIGGYINLDGKTVKQGLVIRGVELDGLVVSDNYIPEEELQNVKDTFGFVYDMDLRDSSTYLGEYTSRFGIPHKFYGAPGYGQIFTAYYKESLRQVFSDLADPEKYPMYLHCTHGADRTGTVVFLLQGILNLSQEDMIREFELTGYQHPKYVESGYMDPVLTGLESYEGDTLNEKIVSFLTTTIGVTQSEIESIRNIFLTE